jgi:hypothetical protein
MASSRPAPAARATLLAATILVFAVASCDAPVPKGSPVCRRGSSRVTVFQGPDGTCIARDRIVGFRCDGAAPLVAFDAGTAKERRFLGGAFAVQVPSLPEAAEVVGVGDGAELVTVGDEPRWLYTVRGSSIERWLSLPDEATLGSTPGAFMLGDSILDGGAADMALALPGWALEVDASNGRSSGEGASIAESRVTDDEVVAVVELGTNDRDPGAFRANARRILSALGDVPLVLWQTVDGPPDLVDADAINAEILVLAGHRSNVAIADWANDVSDEYLFDGVHPDPEHQDAMARLVSPLIRTWWRSVTVGPGCG